MHLPLKVQDFGQISQEGAQTGFKSLHLPHTGL